jgi:hypothetical protein
MVALGREVIEPSVGEEVGFEAVLGRVPRWPGWSVVDLAVDALM